LIKLPDTFAVIDLDLKIARFVPDLDYLMASCRATIWMRTAAAIRV